MVKIRVQKNEEVYISKSEIAQLAMDLIYEVYKIPHGSFIKNGDLMKTETYYTSHSWGEGVVIRGASKDDIAAMSVIKTLREESRKK